MLGVAAQRIAWPIRKPRNNADECHCAETRRDGAFRAICFVAPLARGACHGRRVASRISSRKAAVAATRDLFRGSLSKTSHAQPEEHRASALRSCIWHGIRPRTRPVAARTTQGLPVLLESRNGRRCAV